MTAPPIVDRSTGVPSWVGANSHRTSRGHGAGTRVHPAGARVNGELFSIVLEHARRGVRVQFAIRAVLVVFLAAAILTVPPARGRLVSVAIVIAYGCWAVGFGLASRRGGIRGIRWPWLGLIVDAAALTALTLVAGASAQQTWTADLLVCGFFLIPMLAGAQLRPGWCVAVTVSAIAAYFAVSAATKAANTEPWPSIILRTVALCGLGLGCVLMSRVQLSRVRTISELAEHRTVLLREMLTLESRERANLAERLHDGALQYLLAARHDFDDLRRGLDAVAFDRVDHALREASVLLRTSVGELHPAVLHEAGLAEAVHELADEAAARGRWGLRFESDWPQGPSPADDLLFGCARELLTNVTKHAAAKHVWVQLSRADDQARLTITDDGVGLDPEIRAVRLAEGHIGLASIATRVAASNGRLTLSVAQPVGTRVAIAVPAAWPIDTSEPTRKPIKATSPPSR